MSKDDTKPKKKAKAAEKAKAKTTKAKAKTTKAKTTKTTKAKTTTKTTKAKTTTKPDTKETAKPKPEKAAVLKAKPENTIFVGTKPAMTYVLAIMTCFNEKKAKDVKICARGRAISTAVDVAELTRNKFMLDLKVKSIITSTEKVIRREGGGEANVSAIEITLGK